MNDLNQKDGKVFMGPSADTSLEGGSGSRPGCPWFFCLFSSCSGGISSGSLFTSIKDMRAILLSPPVGVMNPPAAPGDLLETFSQPGSLHGPSASVHLLTVDPLPIPSFSNLVHQFRLNAVKLKFLVETRPSWCNPLLCGDARRLRDKVKKNISLDVR